MKFVSLLASLFAIFALKWRVESKIKPKNLLRYIGNKSQLIEKTYD